MSSHSRVCGSTCLEVAPDSIEEACEVLRLAASEGWAVVPAGSGTWLDVGNPLRRADVIVSTRRMQRLIEHEPADLVATAEAGVTLSALNDELARAGQWLPLDPPDDGRTTIGGMVATGMGGAQSFGYGLPRNSVIGMRVALADGRLIKAGGRVVKNVAGYDLCKLFTGSFGTLCLILELTFKLRPLPAQTTTVAACAPFDSLLRSARSVLDARLLPVAIEYLSPALARRLKLFGGGTTDPVLLIRYAGTPETVNFQAEQTTELFLQDEPLMFQSGKHDYAVFHDDHELWSVFAAFPLDQVGSLVWRASVKPTELRSFFSYARTEWQAVDNTAALYHFSFGEGGLRVIHPLTEDMNSCIAPLQSLRAKAIELGGSLVIENAPPEIKKALDVWGITSASQPLMQRVKGQLDPADALSPGRFVFSN